MSLPFANNSRTLFKYEPFRFEIETPGPISNVATSTNLVPYVTRVDPSAVIIQGVNGYLGAPSSNESVVIDVSGNGRSSNSFVLNPGRFFDVSSLSFDNRTITLFKNEIMTPILFDSCINLARIQSTPSLPPGLSFVSNTPTSYLLQGTPTVQIPTSNYLIIGTGVNPAEIVTTRVFGTTTGGVNVGVEAERIRVNISGTPTISPMVINTPIDTRVVTSSVPSPSNAIVQYNWGPLPSGIQFSNNLGTPYSGTSAIISGNIDASFTLVLNGTPTLETAKSFAAANVSNYTVPVQVFRTSPLPILSNISNAFTFQFVPMVLFDNFTLPSSFYKGAAVNPTQYSFRARTYFKTDASITSITQTGFPSGFSLNFVSNEQRAYLTGTPSVTGTFAATLFATDASGLVGSNPATFVVQDDIVSFVPPTATSGGTFIVSRPLNLFKTGYYTSNIQFKAVANSSCNVSYVVDGLENTGIQTDVSNGILTLTGIPSITADTTVLTVTATASNTLASNSAQIEYAIVNDDISFNQVPLSSRQFIQNRIITPFQITATTLSDRLIASYSGSNFPNSLSISTSGLISGRMQEGTDGSLNVIASTGYVSGSNILSYTVVPDSILLLAPFDSVELFLGENVPPEEIQGISYSGINVSNYQLTSTVDTYGLTIGSNTGILGGVLSPAVTDMTPITITANAGLNDTSLNFMLRVFPSPIRVFLSNVSPTLGNGPVFTSPLSTDYVFYQYVPISPIELQVAGTGDIYFFIETAELPRGLSFDPLTAKITGSPVLLGDKSFTIYARDDNGTTQLTLQTTTIIPRIIKQQSGAGAYTSLVRQYTEVNAAQGGRDTRVFPAQQTRLGEFTAPVPDVVTSAVFSSNKCGTCGRVDCPVLKFDANGAETDICEFIDANAGAIFDAGNAQSNVCS